MDLLDVGVPARSLKENERRSPLHPEHLGQIDTDLREHIFLETGYGENFGVDDKSLAECVAGVRTRDELMESCDVMLLPKPLLADVRALRPGQVLWGWPHCVQDASLTQVGIDSRLTVIAWEAMHLWSPDGSFERHVFAANNQLAGYASVLHAMQLLGNTGHYGRGLRAAVIGSGATALGSVTALNGLGVLDVDVFTHRDVETIAPPKQSVRLLNVENDPDRPGAVNACLDSGPTPLGGLLRDYDVVVNCVLQDTDAPMMFLAEGDLSGFRWGSLIVDVSCDEGMGFSWARPTSFTDPLFTVGDGVHYYAVDHSPSLLWNSATWEISRALTPHLRAVMGGPQAWERNETIRHAIELRDGVIQNPRILSFQHRAPDYPHERTGT
jgi:alanine dehydrogenase